MIKGLHHAAMSVKDLERSVNFYCDLLGMSVAIQRDFEGGIMDQITNLNSTKGRSVLLQVGAQYIELFEFASPFPKPSNPGRRVCDYGISHFCLTVSNVQQEYERLKTMGVEFHCEPQVFGHMKATYGRDPDGNVFELLEIPEVGHTVPFRMISLTTLMMVQGIVA